MPIYKLLVDARNVLIEMDGVREKKAFFTVCSAEAEDAAVAKKKATAILEDRLADSILNNPSDLPTFEFPKIEPVLTTNAKPGKLAGLLWYADTDEENRKQSRKFIEDIFTQWQ